MVGARHGTGLALTLLLTTAGVGGAEIRGAVVFPPGSPAAPVTLSVRLEPLASQELAPHRAANHRVLLRDGRLKPAHLAAHTGDRIEFVNQDPMQHRLRLAGGGGTAERALAPADEPGAGAALVLEQAATVHVVCTLHERLYARIDVLERGQVHMLEAPGEFRFTDLPAGAWRLRIGSVRGTLHEREVLAFTAPPRLRIVVPRPPPPLGLAQAFRPAGVEALFPGARP